MTGRQSELSRAVVIVSPHFPPLTLAGVHRARHLAKHLPAAGWMPIVLCVNERYQEQVLDPALASLVPRHIEVIKVPALASGRCLGISDVSLRAWIPLRRRLMQLLASRPIETVLITGSPFYSMLMVPEIKQRFGVPVVLDFQDPWVSHWGAEQPLFSKAGFTHWLATRLEPYAVRGADFVTSVSDLQNWEMAKRYAWLDDSRMAGLPIGGDPDDFDQMRSADVALPNGVLDPKRANLSFVGTFMPRSGRLVRLVLQALQSICREQPEFGKHIRLNFVGTSNQANDCTTLQVIPIAQEMGVVDAVHETPQRLPYLQALAVLARSDGLLLIGSDEPHYTASKIYPALMSGRPYLSLFHYASSSHAILSSAGGGFAHAFCDDNDVEDLVSELATNLRKLVLEPAQLGRVDRAAYASVEARAIAARFGSIFDEISRCRCR